VRTAPPAVHRAQFDDFLDSNLRHITAVTCFLPPRHTRMSISERIRFRVRQVEITILGGAECVQTGCSVQFWLWPQRPMPKIPSPTRSEIFSKWILCSAAAGQMVSNDGGEQSLCQEYVLQSERVTYRIRPRNEKDSVLLPVGEPVRFRFQADRIVLRVEDLSGSHLPGKDSRGKDHQYVVVSMSPRSDNSTADATPTRLNHLQ